MTTTNKSEDTGGFWSNTVAQVLNLVRPAPTLPRPPAAHPHPLLLSPSIQLREQFFDLLLGASLPLEHVCYAFAYGSGAIPQKGEDAKQKMVDFIIVCNDSRRFHQDNILRNPAHYSLWFRRFMHVNSIYRFQRIKGARIFYNTLIPSRGRLIKYGVIETEDLETDLLDWEWLYIAGRLHKPVLDLINGQLNNGLGQEPSKPIWQAMADNRWMALQTALLSLPPKFSMEDILRKIVSFSYKGDFRMGVAEDPQKVDKLVAGAAEQLRQIYLPLLSKDDRVNIISDGEIEQDYTTPTIFHRLQMLPYAVQRGLRNVYFPKGRLRYSDTEELIYFISHRHDLPQSLDSVLANIVRRSSRTQSFKNFFTAGMVRSLRYIWPKLGKGIGKKISFLRFFYK